MKIKVKYIESENSCVYEMFRIYDGRIVNCGGRIMPF